ncbi:MAG: hypothetical protein JW941_12025, partial [Candidatus Coatesbacteria bacterium]|nr:hypothetical protein [Candidatus Coatesbacteria bacterium]
SLGRIWARGVETCLIGIYGESTWRQLCGAVWLPNDELILKFYAAGQMALDLDSGVWVRSIDGARRFGLESGMIYNDMNSDLMTGGYVATDALGTVWFSNPPEFGGPSDAVAVGFREETWYRYSTTDCFSGERPSDMTIGPDNEIWFRRLSGYSVFDGADWRQVPFGSLDIPHEGRLFFDLNGTAYLASRAFSDERKSFYVKRPSQDWTKEMDVLVKDLQVDSDGTVWLAAAEGLYMNQGEGWATAPFNDEVSATESSIAYAEGGALRIAIDHDGNKWIGTPAGLSRVADGGPAQQSVGIELTGPDAGELIVSLTLVNAGRPIAVDVWSAVELNGNLIYLPFMSSEPISTAMVLWASTTESVELIRLSYDDLPAGTYNLYAAMSLPADSTKMIGPVDDKIAFASFKKE